MGARQAGRGGAVAVLAALAGCPGVGKDSDSGASGCGQAPQITDYNIECFDRSCDWWVEASAPMGTVIMTAIETGDPTFTCGPKGGLECGVWKEEHDGFQLDGGVGACGERKSLTVEIVNDYRDQVDNRSTLFDIELSAVTVLLEVYAPDGSFADCRVTGHDPSYFRSDCTEVDY